MTNLTAFIWGVVVTNMFWLILTHFDTKEWTALFEDTFRLVRASHRREQELLDQIQKLLTKGKL